MLSFCLEFVHGLLVYFYSIELSGIKLGFTGVICMTTALSIYFWEQHHIISTNTSIRGQEHLLFMCSLQSDKWKHEHLKLTAGSPHDERFSSFTCLYVWIGFADRMKWRFRYITQKRTLRLTCISIVRIRVVRNTGRLIVSIPSPLPSKTDVSKIISRIFSPSTITSLKCARHIWQSKAFENIHNDNNSKSSLG